jgi:hypothetical protein
VAKIVAVVPDLMLASRVKESLTAAGHQVSVSATLPKPAEADAIVCDLDAADINAIAATGIPSLGFYSHVDVNTKARAQKTGIALIVPRSRMARELPQLVDGLLQNP